MGRPGPAWPRVGVDLLVVVASLSAAAGTVLREDPSPPTGVALWWQPPAIAGAVLLLLWRERLPFAAPAGIWVVCGVLSFLDGSLVPSQPAVLLAGLGAALLLGSLRDRSLSRVGLAVGVGVTAIVVVNKPSYLISELIFTPLMVVVSWVAGSALRERSVQAEAAQERAAVADRRRETAARLAVAEERARIARELHDVVAHALSVMVLQVSVVRRRRPPAEAEDREALRNVEEAGRAALTEMRRLLDAMRRDDDPVELGPQPGLEDLGALLEEVRATGLDVRLRVHGDLVTLPPVLELSAYRIVQEGLTNTLKHARARRAEVDLRYGAGDLVVEVADDGTSPTATGDGDGQASGFGLVGIRERVTLLGGEMSAGPSPHRGRGFVLRARLPLQASRT